VIDRTIPFSARLKYQFSDAKQLGEIPTGLPQMDASNRKRDTRDITADNMESYSIPISMKIRPMKALVWPVATSHRWTVYVTPKSPKGWHKNAISLFVPVKFNFCRKKSATKFLCMKTSSGKVVATSFPYPTVHRSIAGDVPIYLKLAFKVTHPFRKRRFPKLSFKSAIGLGVFWSCFSRYDKPTLAIQWHPQTILRRSSQGNPSVWVFKRKG